MTMMPIATSAEAELTASRKVHNPNSSLQFEIAAQAQADRDAVAHAWPGPQCTCHTGRIDGVLCNFICANCAIESAHIPNPHEAAIRGRKRL